MHHDAALVARVAEQLERDGYAVMEGIMPADMLETYRRRIDALMAEEQERPYAPEDGTVSAEDEAITDFLPPPLHGQRGGDRAHPGPSAS